MKNFDDFLRWEQISRDSIDVKRIYIDIAGDLVTGILLSQIIFWHLPSGKNKSKLTVFRNGKEWLAKKREDWWDECRISPKQFDRSIAILKKVGLVEVSTFKFHGNPTKHIHLCEEKLLERVNSFLTKGEEPTSPKVKKDVDVSGSSFHCTENTSENTAEKPPLTPQGDQAKTPAVLSPFELFWEAYPKKRSRGQAEKTFKKLNPDQELLNHILTKLEEFKQSKNWRRLKGKYIPYPSTWLNAQGWKDKFETEVEPMDPLDELEPRTVSDAKWLDSQRQARFLLEEDQDKIKELYNE